MNSQHLNPLLFARFLFALVVCASVLTLLLGGMSNSARVRGSLAEDDEKLLGIWRFANEPVELIDLKIDQKSVKGDVKLKSKDPRSHLEQHNVKFKGGENWFKKIHIKLRNVSGRPIYALTVTLYFLPSGTTVGFKLPLKTTQLRNLKTHPLQPGEELDLDVKDSAFEETVATMIRHGFNPAPCGKSMAFVGSLPRIRNGLIENQASSISKRQGLELNSNFCRQSPSFFTATFLPCALAYQVRKQRV